MNKCVNFEICEDPDFIDVYDVKYNKIGYICLDRSLSDTSWSFNAISHYFFSPELLLEIGYKLRFLTTGRPNNLSNLTQSEIDNDGNEE